MKQANLLLATLLSLGFGDALAAKPAPKVETAAPAEAVPSGAPTWCDGVTEKLSSTPESLELASEYFNGMTLGEMRDLVLYSCESPGDEGRRAWVQAVRQSLSNQHGLTLADNERLMKLAAKTYGQGGRYQAPSMNDNPVCQKLAPITTGPENLRLIRSLERIGVGCGDWNTQENRSVLGSQHRREEPAVWVVDYEGGFDSELAKAVFVKSQMTNFRALGESTRKDLRYYRNWVNASGVTLDDAAFRRQLAAMDLPEEAEMRAVLTFRGAMAEFAERQRFIEDAAKKDKAVAAMFFKGPEAARAQWAKEAAANKAVFESVLALEAKRTDTPGGMTGCASQLFPAFQGWARDYAKANPSTSVQEMTMGGYLGSALAYGLTLCGLNDKEAPVMERVFEYYLRRTLVQRGPIAASVQGMVNGANESHGTSGLTDLASPAVQLPSMGMSVHTEDSPMDPTRLPSGVVAKVTPKGNQVLITFKKETRKEPVYECFDTKEIWYVTPGGNVRYRRACKKVSDQTVTGAPAPLTVPRFAAGGIKPGNLVRFWKYTNGESAGSGWPVEVFADGSRKRRVNLLGAQL
ncbi:hypothetical protein D7V80_37770 [Corallococcus sp. CA054B]|uniref:hypothetical protein n=1 Tax=Corallococcus sp. CA054B TaxID=2316734 RepID=UPI000EA1C71F|nr:hypothetical protein [Corallococcus sp. CA054B]RKG59079.1 hypothetical protein D7V80_37770 [Corallococcus sp. CA054B]